MQIYLLHAILGCYRDAGSRIKYFLVQFNLASENVVASWYSSMLLLLISFMAFLCFIADQMRYQSHRERYLSFGWLFVAFVFGGLSFDEMGSLHEHIGMLAVLNPFGDYALGWVKLLAIPVGLVGLFMLAFGWVHIRRNRWVLALLTLGVLLFLSIPIQENIEMTLFHSASDMETWQRPILHILLEEGAELFGMLCFFSATMLYVISAARQETEGATVSRLDIKVKMAVAFVGTIAFICLLGFGMVIIELVLPYMSSGDTGIPQNWFPSALAGLVAIICLLLWDTVPRHNKPRRYLYLTFALFSIALSVYYGANMAGWLSMGREFAAHVRQLTLGSLVIGTVILGVSLAMQVESWWSRAGTFAWILLLGLSVSYAGIYAAPLAFVAFALLLLSLLAHLYSQPISETIDPQTSGGQFHSRSVPRLGRLPYLRDLLRELVSRDMKLRYKRSALGIIWSLLNPLAQLLVLNLIFGWVLPLNIDNYPVFLFIGLLVWTWFQTSLFGATSVIIDNPDLIRRPGFPVAILPIVTVSTNLIHFLLALPVLLLFLPSGGVQVSAALLALPLLIALQFLLTLSLSYALAAIHVTFRDTQYLLGIALLLGFYLSPIFYATSLIPEQVQWLYRLNPMVDLIDSYRAILMQGSLPHLLPLLIIGLCSIAMLWLGYSIFVHQSYRFVEET